MVENARALAARLGALERPAGYDVRYALFVNETHLTGISAATSRAIAFVLAPNRSRCQAGRTALTGTGNGQLLASRKPLQASNLKDYICNPTAPISASVSGS